MIEKEILRIAEKSIEKCLLIIKDCYENHYKNHHFEGAIKNDMKKEIDLIVNELNKIKNA